VTEQFREWKEKGRMELVRAYTRHYEVLVEVIEGRLVAREKREGAGNAWGGGR